MEPRPISLFSGLAVKKLLQASVLPEFSAAHHYTVDATFEPTQVLVELITAGARPDVMLGVRPALARLVDEGVLASETLRPLVRSGIGVAVPPGSTVPSIETVDEFIAAIRSARSVAYSRTGASGQHFTNLLERFGIAEEVNRHACILEKGFTAEALLDGRADLAVQQVIELASVDGPTIVGPLPEDAQHYVDLWVGTSVDAHPDAGTLLRALCSPAALRIYQAAGLDVTVAQTRTGAEA